MAVESENKASSAQGVAEAVKGILEAVPIYQDAVQPFAIEAGKALGTVGKAVNAALFPLRAMIWSTERLEAFFVQDVAEKLKDVPFDQIITPDPAVAGPAIEALRYAGEKEDLRELYANLLAGAMNAQTADDVHPAYVEVLRQLSVEDAQNLRYFERGLIVYVVSVMATDQQIRVPPDEPVKPVEISIQGSSSGDFIISGPGPGAGTRPYITAAIDMQAAGRVSSNLKRLGIIEDMANPLGNLPPRSGLPDDDIFIANEAHIREAGKHPFTICKIYILGNFGASFMLACGLNPYGYRTLNLGAEPE